MATNPFFHTVFSIPDSLKSVRKNVLIYETIIHTRMGYVQTSTELKLPPDPYKGFGLIDVYRGSLKVIGNLADPYISRICETLSKPVTNGEIPATVIQYPLVHSEELKAVSWETSNYIYVSTCIQELQPLFHRLKMELNEDGLSYQDSRFVGSYCVMLIQPHPFHPEHSVLYITANDKKVFNSVLFFRKMILPAYASGYHPFLNNEALIFCSGVFHKIRYIGEKKSKTASYG